MSVNFTFKAVILYAFDRIMSRYGYKLREADDSYVRLDSQKISIQLHYDRLRSFEVGVEFCELVNGECLRHVPFNLREIFCESGVPDADAASFFQSSDIFQVSNYLVSVVEKLIKYCEPAIIGDQSYYEAVNHRRTIESAAYTQQIQLQSVRDQADQAWRNKEYKEFVNLIAKFKDVLPDSDQKRLEFAEKKLTV